MHVEWGNIAEVLKIKRNRWSSWSFRDIAELTREIVRPEDILVLLLLQATLFRGWQ
jgi:hypothetical protein